MVKAWFWLVRNMIAKYGIQEPDIYNFDKTGFLMVSWGWIVLIFDPPTSEQGAKVETIGNGKSNEAQTA